MSDVLLSERAKQFMTSSLSGDSRVAMRIALDLLDSGVTESAVISDVLAVSQREVGNLWQRDALSIADEHVATGVAESTLFALTPTDIGRTSFGRGSIVVACAEGDWHSVAAHMIAEQLRSEGFATKFLGASIPARDMARFLNRHRPDALAVSCNLAIFYSGVMSLVNVAHSLKMPVLVGGRAFSDAPARAWRLGADGYGATVAEAIDVLSSWLDAPPRVEDVPRKVDPMSIRLAAMAPKLASVALNTLATKFPAMAEYSSDQMERTREDLVYIVRFIAEARLVRDELVFTEFLDWLVDVLEARGVPPFALKAGLESLLPLVVDEDPAAGDIAAIGIAHLEGTDHISK